MQIQIEDEEKPEDFEEEDIKEEGEQNQIETIDNVPSFSSLYHGHGVKLLTILQCIIIFLAIVAFTVVQANSEYPKRSLELLLQGQAAVIFFHHLIYIIAGNYDWNSMINLSAVFMCIANFVFYLSISVTVIRIFYEPVIYEFSYTVWSKSERFAITISASLGCVISILLILECALFLMWYQRVGIFEALKNIR